MVSGKLIKEKEQWKLPIMNYYEEVVYIEKNPGGNRCFRLFTTSIENCLGDCSEI